jgi:hypothetical protein
MRTRNHFLFKLFTVFTIFAYSAMQTVPAFADDGVPPASDSPVVESQLEELATPEEVISQLPEGTDVVVLSESGDTVPLATQEAADGFVEGDPMWCPTGVAPKENVGGCSPSFTDFGFDSDLPTNSLLGWLNTNDPKKAGTIWVANDYDSSTESNADIIIDGNNYDFMDAYALTVQGGWEYNTTGSKALFTADPYSYFTDSTFFVATWNNAVTINNIVMDGVQINQTGENQTLYVSTTGNIVLNNVIVRDSYNIDDSEPVYIFNGAILDNNMSGAGTGSVTINNSEFLNNEGDGLTVYSKGVITTNNLTANSNGRAGAFMDNSLAQGKAITLKGFKQFNDNGGDGLVIISSGAMTLSNIVANNNLGNGVNLDNRTSAANLGIVLGGTNFTMNNGLDGTVLLSQGMITASNLNASGNGQSGAILDNCGYISGCDVASGKMVKLSGVNVFNGNGAAGVPDDQDGLVIESFGAISISNLMASDNYGNGVYLDNEWHNLNNVYSTGTIAITGYGIFQNNGADGAEIYSYGNAVLTNIDASGNGDDGLYMVVEKNSGGSSITINGLNNFSDNGEDGLDLYAHGTITLNNVTAVGNITGTGAYLANTYHPLKPYNVVLKGTNKFNENGMAGLVVESFGTIQVNNLMASGNSGDAGVILDNCIGFLSCVTLRPKAVTITGYAITSDNLGGMGLAINSYGAITLNNVTASGNGLEGTVLQNDYNLAGQAVTLKGSNTFNENGGNGGLGVFTLGTITANNVTASGNEGVGALFVNCQCLFGLTPRNVTLTGVNTFVDNGQAGLVVESSGSVVLSRVTASDNDSDVTDNDGVGISVVTDGNITLTCAFTTNNNDGGYYLDTLGKITLNGIYSNNPGGSGDITISPSVPTIKKPCALP